MTFSKEDVLNEVKEALRAGGMAALEEAAKIAEEHPSDLEYVPYKAVHKSSGRAIAAKIRELAKGLK